MEEKKLAVIALGGNAILRGNQKGTVEEQNQNIRETLENLIYLVREGYNLIITHGNGPQVGNILMSDDAGVKMYGLPPMTLDMCVAYSQGEIGYMIERNLRNILREKKSRFSSERSLRNYSNRLANRFISRDIPISGSIFIP